MIHELFIVLVLFFFIFRFSEVEKEISRCFEGFPYIAFTVYLAHAPYDLFDDRFGYKLVSRADGGTEADFVHACKHGNEAPIFFGIPYLPTIRDMTTERIPWVARETNMGRG